MRHRRIPPDHMTEEHRRSQTGTSGLASRLGEQTINDQFQGLGVRLTTSTGVRVFATPAACFGDAVTTIVAMVDTEAAAP